MFNCSRKMKKLFMAASVLLMVALPIVAIPQVQASPGQSAAGAQQQAYCRSLAMDMDASPVASGAVQHLLKILTPSAITSQGRHASHPTTHAIAGSVAGHLGIPFCHVLQTVQVRLHNELFGAIFNCRAPPAFSTLF